MNYNEFKNEFIAKMEQALVPNGFSVEIRQVIKNNDHKLDGLVARPKDSAVAPTIYIQQYYDDYLAGKTVDELVTQTKKLILEKEKVFTEAPKITREIAKECLSIMVVNAAANKEMLANTPHRVIEDLAIVPRFRVDMDKESIGSFRVTNELLGHLQMTKDEVLRYASENAEKQGFTCKSMQQVMAEMFGADMDDAQQDMLDELFPSAEAAPMYVLSNSEKVYGASAVACKSVLSDAVEKIGEECYILPSSVHELLLVPKSRVDDVQDLRDMVFEINRTQVMPDEVLSDSVYELNPLTKKLQIATGKEEVQVPHVAKSKCL